MYSYLTDTLSSDLGNSNSINSSLVITSDSGLLLIFTNGQKINSHTENAWQNLSRIYTEKVFR